MFLKTFPEKSMQRDITHGSRCTGSVRVVCAIQIDGSVNSEGVRPETVIFMTWPNPSKIRKTVPPHFFRAPRGKQDPHIFSALRAENWTPGLLHVFFVLRAENRTPTSPPPRSARKTGLPQCFCAVRAENRQHLFFRATRGKQDSFDFS